MIGSTMPTLATKCLAFALVLLLSLGVLGDKEAAAAQKGESGSQKIWEIGPRLLPASHSISEPLRDQLQDASPPDLKGAETDYPRSIDGWKSDVRKADVAGAAAARALAKSISVEVESATVAGVPVFRIAPPQIDPRLEHQLFVHLHGGAYMYDNGEAATYEGVQIASAVGIRTVSIDYRQAPDHPAPAAMEDVVAVWRAILDEYPFTRLVLGGSSAGGGLTLVSVLRFKDLGLALPAVLMVGTPAADLGYVGDSRFTNAGIDRNLITWEGASEAATALYVGNHAYDDPYISPIYGDFAGFPPTYLISGTRGLMLSDTVRVHRKLRVAGVEAALNVYEGVSHEDYLMQWNQPIGKEHYKELKAFILEQLEP